MDKGMVFGSKLSFIYLEEHDEDKTLVDRESEMGYWFRHNGGDRVQSH